MANLREVDRKQAFGGLVQEKVLDPSKVYHDLELYFQDPMIYLYTEIDRLLRAKGPDILFWWCASQVQPATAKKR